MECSICCEKFNKSTHLLVDCKGCDDSADPVCRKCSQTFILGSSNDPCCMLCKSKWDREFINKYLTKSFINTKLKEHTENIFMDREISKLPDTQVYAQQVKQIQGISDRIAECEAQKNRLLRLVLKQKDLSRDLYAEINRIRYNGVVQTSEEKKFTYKCPNGECKGFLGGNWKCGLCDIKYCKDCMEPKEENHECDKNTKETFQLIKKDTKPCPKCGELIFKLSGCSQMWCTICHTTFDWRTGQLEAGTVHNPEYYRWMRESGQTLARNPLDVPHDPCGNRLINHNDLLRFMRRLFPSEDVASPHPAAYAGRGLGAERRHIVDKREVIITLNIHRMINHITHKVNFHNQERTHMENQLRDLRVKYLLNNLDKETWKRQLQILEKANIKGQDYINVWNLLGFILNEAMTKITTCTNKDVVVNILKEVEMSREFCNESFKKVGKLYTNVYPGIDINWVEQRNWKVYCKHLKEQNK
jgi:hypothetical protein